MVFRKNVKSLEHRLEKNFENCRQPSIQQITDILPKYSGGLPCRFCWQILNSSLSLS